MTDAALVLDSVTVDYGRNAVLNDLSFTVEEGSVTCVVGPNGAGKTTTIRAIGGLLPFHRGTVRAGSIRLFGEEVTALTPAAIVQRGLAVVPEGRRVFSDMTVDANLRVGAANRTDGGIDADIGRMLERFPQLRRRGVPAGYLSGGEQQMLAIARALMAKPKLILLDEPSLGLAPKIAEDVMRVVQQIRGDGCSVLLVEQNVRRGLGTADTGHVMDMGRVVISGPADQVMADERVRDSYLGLEPVPQDDAEPST